MDRIRRATTRAALAALALVVVAPPGASTVAHAGPDVTLAASAKPVAPAGSAVRRDRAGLPDTVLARVGTSRPITRAAFLRQWRDAHRTAPPDSLTPASARRFLEVLIDRELLAEGAAAHPWAPTAEESLQLAGLQDRLAVSLALDSLLEQAGGAGAAPGSVEAAQQGILVRDSVVAALAPSFDRPLLERLAHAWTALPKPTADSSLGAQLRMMQELPNVAAADTARIVARSPVGDVQVHDLLDSWRRLPAVYRPRIETADQVEDLVKNALFQRVLRSKAAAWNLPARPEVRAVIDRQRENLAIARFVEQRVGRVQPDPAALGRWFDQRREAFSIPTRVQMVRLSFDSREAADRMAARLRDAVEADSLAARAERSGIPYRVRLSAGMDSVLFRAAMRSGPGTVVGPLRSRGEWVIARVEAILPGRGLELSEVRAEAEARWTAEENERRLEALAAELAKSVPVAVNDLAVRATATRYGRPQTSPAKARGRK
jgi:hypothetical protein